MRRYSLWLMLGVLSGFLWGCNNYLYDVGARGAITDSLSAGIIFPLACTAVNDMSAAIFLLFVNGLRGVLRSVHTLLNRSGAVLCLAALLGGPLGQLSYCLGILWAGPTYALALSALYPVIGCVLARFFLHQQINVRMACGIALAVAGAIITGFTTLETAAPLILPGMICAFIAALCWGSEIVLAVHGMSNIEPDLAITLRESISGTVLLLMTVAFFSGGGAIHALFAVPAALGTLMIAGVIAGISYFLWYAVNRAIGCARGMATNATYIIWGVVLQWGMGGSEASGQILLGCALVFAGVLLVSLYPQEGSMAS